MASMKLAPPRIVAAVDFGTTFSGFAFARVSSTGGLEMHHEPVQEVFEWPDQHRAFISYCKTITSLIYEETAPPAIKAWGWPAFLEGKQGQAQARRYYERFKLYLSDGADKIEGLRPPPKGKTGEEMIADFLRQMYEFALRNIKDVAGDVPETDIQWCLTVPAIWSEAAKCRMKNAAQRAGMSPGRYAPVGRGSRYPVMVVLEPEAASLYCFEQYKDSNKEVFADPYMVVDIGGGTVDLVVHQVERAPDYIRGGEETLIRERAPGSGGLCGGSILDDRFKALLASKLKAMVKERGYELKPEDKAPLNIYEEKNPRQYLNLLKTWEQAKRSFTGLDENLMVDIPPQLMDIINECAGVGDEDGDDDIDESLAFTSTELVEDVFGPITEEIRSLIDNQLAEMTGMVSCKTVFLVGGFSSSPFLKEKLIAHLTKQGIKVLHPPNPGNAVTVGAVLFGLRPASIVSRCARVSYGLKAARPVSDDDPVQNRFHSQGKQYCFIFEKFVTRGDEIHVDHSVNKTYRPLRDNQTCVDLPIISAPHANVKYFHEPGVLMLHAINIPVARKDGWAPTITVNFRFGGTSVEVFVKNSHSPADEDPTRVELSYQ